MRISVINLSRIIILVVLAVLSFPVMGQIGYQVSLLNNATGEPRANESVNVVVRISDSDGGIICEQTKQETTNDFGVLSMTVGDSGTFGNVDWSKLPFFIEANVDGRLIGKSQILSVPVAEYAKQTGVLTKELLCSKTWKYTDEYSDQSITFSVDNTFKSFYQGDSSGTGKYEIDGNFIALKYIPGNEDYNGALFKYCPSMNTILRIYEDFHYK